MKNKFENYKVNRSSLTRERPLGVTGLLRCRNCADYLEICIESCIDALDELIVVYHDCIDDTPSILHEKQLQYPDKIKVFEYEPFIYPIDLNDEQFEIVTELPEDSVHLLSGYYNYGLSKASYRYVVKIDADQIYFQDKFKRLCDAYRSTKKVQFNLLECISYNLYCIYRNSFNREEMKPFRWVEQVATWLYPFHFSYIEKMVIRYKTPISLSGINMFIADNKWMIELGEDNPNALGRKIYSPFNGVGDTVFFEVSKEMSFTTTVAKRSPGNNRVLEVLHRKQDTLDIGFCWFHLKAILETEEEEALYLYKNRPDRFLSLKLLKKDSYRILQKNHLIYFPAQHTESMFSYFYTATRKKIPWKILDEIFVQYNFLVEIDKKQNMVNTRDYYIEFHEELDKRLDAFTSTIEQTDKQLVMLGDQSVKTALSHQLYYQLMQEKESYSQCRIKGMDVNKAMNKIDKYLNSFQFLSSSTTETPKVDLRNHDWYKMLSDYKNLLVVYVFNQRLLQYLIPLIKKIEQPILLLSEYELPDEIDLPESVTALTLAFSDEKVFSNPFIEKYFPNLFQYANTFSILMQIIEPKGVLCLEGCHLQERLLAIFSQSNKIPVIGIQQGWPSFMHTTFRRLPYDYYLTWGEGYNKLWAENNPIPQFIPTGYMYSVKECSSQNSRNNVTFFLQGPVLLSDRRYFDDLPTLITTVAQQFSEVNFRVREHPEFKLSTHVLEKWKTHSNIEIVSDWKLEEVFSDTLITVSHFSSTLMEGIVHGAIPLVYDPTTDSHYCPDVEKEKIGMISKTKEEFCEKLMYILKNKKTFQQQIAKDKQKWFAAVGKETLDNMLNFINMKTR